MTLVTGRKNNIMGNRLPSFLKYALITHGPIDLRATKSCSLCTSIICRNSLESPKDMNCCFPRCENIRLTVVASPSHAPLVQLIDHVAL